MQKTLQELNLMDDFLFQEVLGDEQEGVEAARLILETVMGRTIGEVTVVTQKTATTGITGQHSIRMDVYLKEDSGIVFDLEAQKEDTKELPQRTRYYQALLDGRLLKAGDMYRKLPMVMIILIMSEDIFQKDRMFYTFENRCVELPELSLEDGAKKIFLYTKGTRGGNRELAELLHYIESSRKENAVTSVTKRLHQIVTHVKHNGEVGVRYMKALEYEMWIREKATKEGMEEGIAKGIAKGMEEGIAKGMEEGIAKGMEEGIAKGMEEGRVQEFVRLVIKKMEKGQNAEQIADALEEETERILEIIGYVEEAKEKQEQEELSYVVQRICEKQCGREESGLKAIDV